MKKIGIISVLFLSGYVALMAQNNGEKEQMEALIAQESAQFYQRNFHSWADCYLHDEKIQWVCVEPGEVILEAYGWNFLSKFVGDYLAANPEPVVVSILRNNWVWRSLGPDVYWITFDETKTEKGIVSKFKSTRIIERKENFWKISGMFSYPMT